MPDKLLPPFQFSLASLFVLIAVASNGFWIISLLFPRGVVVGSLYLIGGMFVLAVNVIVCQGLILVVLRGAIFLVSWGLRRWSFREE